MVCVCVVCVRVCVRDWLQSLLISSLRVRDLNLKMYAIAMLNKRF